MSVLQIYTRKIMHAYIHAHKNSNMHTYYTYAHPRRMMSRQKKMHAYTHANKNAYTHTYYTLTYIPG